MNSAQALSRLDDRIELAIKEIERLRDENRLLRSQLEKSQKVAERDVAGTSIVFEGSAEELRSRIDGCIASIDARLKESQAS